MVNERGSPKTGEASSKLISCFAKLAFALFASDSKLRAMIESSAINERARLCKRPTRNTKVVHLRIFHFHAGHA